VPESREILNKQFIRNFLTNWPVFRKGH